MHFSCLKRVTWNFLWRWFLWNESGKENPLEHFEKKTKNNWRWPLQVRFSERKKFKAQEDKIRQVFDNLIQLEHPNIVKFHKYWIDSRDDKPRVLGTFSSIDRWQSRGSNRSFDWVHFLQVIFITEYMSSGSLKQFLKRTKRNVKKPPLQAWKRWCTQILSALRWSWNACLPFPSAASMLSLGLGFRLG